MKKILVLLIAVIVGMACFTGCSSVNQLNMISIGWLDYEQYIYNVYDNSAEEPQLIGEMVYSFKRVNNGTINGKEFDCNKGCLTTYSLTINDGKYKGSTMQSSILFDSLFVPVASYKEYNALVDGQRNDDVSYTIFADYTTSDKNGTYVRNGGEPKEFKRVNKSVCYYDNESIYTLIRASVFSSSSYSLSLNLLNNEDFTTRSVSVYKNNVEVAVKTEMTDIENPTFVCTCIGANMTADKGNGTARYIYFTDSPITVDGKDIVKAMVKIEEDKYSYVLKEINVVE